MSQAIGLLNEMTEGATVAEEHIVISSDRTVYVPDSLKRIGVQGDHNIETVTFDCPKYWDGHDLSKMYIYVNYMREDGYTDACLCTNVTPDATDTNMMHFDWTVSGNVTAIKGMLRFLVNAKTIGEDGVDTQKWHSELNEDMFITEGLEAEQHVVVENPDIITEMLTRLRKAEKAFSGERFDDIEQRLDTAEGEITELKAKDEALSEKDAELEERVGALEELPIGKVITINNKELRFFVGEQSEFNQLTQEQKLNLVSIITDDKSKENILEAIRLLQEFKAGIGSGDIMVPAADKAVHDADGNNISGTYVKQDFVHDTVSGAIDSAVTPLYTGEATVAKAAEAGTAATVGARKPYAMGSMVDGMIQFPYDKTLHFGHMYIIAFTVKDTTQIGNIYTCMIAPGIIGAAADEDGCRRIYSTPSQNNVVFYGMPGGVSSNDYSLGWLRCVGVKGVDSYPVPDTYAIYEL